MSAGGGGAKNALGAFGERENACGNLSDLSGPDSAYLTPSSATSTNIWCLAKIIDGANSRQFEPPVMSLHIICIVDFFFFFLH